MSFKDLLVTLDASETARRRLEIAAALAARSNAHLIGLFPVPFLEPVAYPFYLDAALLGPVLDAAQKRGEERAAEARRAFEEVTRRHGVVGEWRITSGFPGEEAALHARYVDLTIVGQLDPATPTASLDQPPPDYVALAAGRPVLVIPYAGRFDTLGTNVLIAWNTSREATRAVADAMPLLRAAQRVKILVINPRQGVAQHGAVPGADIALHLARHGVKAEVEQTSADDIGVGELLLSRAADLGSDLLVMGAYGHSRARELVVGGATRTVLQSMTIPVLMSH